MKNKKLIYILAAIGACTLLAFSIFIFPMIIAATPENRELETLETEDPYPQEELSQLEEREPEKQYIDGITEQQFEAIIKHVHEEFIRQQNPNPAEGIDINAITKEMAIEIVEGFYPNEATETFTDIGPMGDARKVSLRPLDARYISAPDSTAAPVWQVFLHERTQGTMHYYIPDGHTAESYLVEFQNHRATQLHGCCYSDSIYRRNTGSTVIKSESSIESIILIELDAFTGKALGSGFFAFCEHYPNYNSFVENGYLDLVFITDSIIEDKTFLPGSEGQPYRRYEVIPEPTPQPTP